MAEQEHPDEAIDIQHVEVLDTESLCPPQEAPVESRPIAAETMHKRPNILRRAFYAGALVVGLGIGTYAATHPSPDWKAAHVADIVHTGIEDLELAAPFILTAAAVGTGSMLRNEAGIMKLKMAARGLTSTELSSSTWRGTGRRLLRQAMIPAIGIAAAGTAFTIESGLINGTNNAIQSMAAVVPAGAEGHTNWVYRDGALHLMDDSDVARKSVEKLTAAVELGSVPGVSKVLAAMKTTLTVIPTAHNRNQAGLLISVDNTPDGLPSKVTPPVEPGALCEVQDERCVLAPNEIEVDKDEGYKIGETLTVQGRPYKVVAFAETHQSILNREVAYSGLSEAQKTEGYSWLIVEADSKQAVENGLGQLGLSSELSTETTKEFLKANQDVWTGNGSTLLGLLILDLSVFASTTFLMSRQAEQIRNKQLIATVEAIGAGTGDIVAIERAGVAMKTALAVPFAYLASKASEFYVVNTVVPGFHGKFTLPMLGASTALFGVAQAAGIPRTTKRQHKKESLAARRAQA